VAELEAAAADFALPELDIPDDLLQQLAAPDALEASALPLWSRRQSRSG
jgi:chemosensory pili system protein ChpA (sensor histidine kinase/response regulator)